MLAELCETSKNYTISGKLLSLMMCWPQLPERVWSRLCWCHWMSLSLCELDSKYLQIPLREELEEVRKGKGCLDCVDCSTDAASITNSCQTDKAVSQWSSESSFSFTKKSWYWMLNTSLVMLSYALRRLIHLRGWACMKNVTVIPEDDDKCEIFTAWVSPGVLKCCTLFYV